MPALKFVRDWFVTNKMLEKRGNAVFSNEDTFFINKDSDNVTFLGNDIGLNTDLILTLMTIILTMMTLELLFMLDFWLGVIDIDNARHIKNDKQRINACSMTSSKVVGLVRIRR